MGDQLSLIDLRPLVEVVQCGKRLRVRAVSAGTEKSWFVAFPRKLRTSGLIYRVARLIPVASRRYYRALGPFERV